MQITHSSLTLKVHKQWHVCACCVAMQAVSGSQLPSGCVSLEQHMSRMCEENPGARVTLAVHGMNAYRRQVRGESLLPDTIRT